MKVAIEGCAHGELDNIYQSIRALEEDENIKVDLLICCGDFQSTRNEFDLRCMAVPPKYYDMCSFYKYYNGEKKAPVLTIFIGGNHEASNYLQELPFGGWVAPNIYYLGYAGVINIGGLRIAGISGIYKGKDYMKGHYEMTPYSEDTKRSVYHIRNVEVFRLRQLSQPVDVFLSHDWPANITQFGNEAQLLRFKPFFREDIESGKLGSLPCNDILHELKPKYWFAAHLHCKFAALVEHEDGSTTKFLALDKCLPKKRFLQILDLPHGTDNDMGITYDLEWLAILHATNHLLSTKSTTQFMPSKSGQERWNFTPSDEEKQFVLSKFGSDLRVPFNFKVTAKSYSPSTPLKRNANQPPPMINPQTTEFCSKLGILDPAEILIKLNGSLDLSHLSETTYEGNTSRSFIDDTIDADSPCKTPIPRISLVLPMPINESQSFADGKIENDFSTSKDNDDASADVEEKQSVQVTGTPCVKKFKRRNASIYDNDG